MLFNPPQSLGGTSSNEYLRRHIQKLARNDRVWLVLWDAPAEVDFKQTDLPIEQSWNQFGKTTLLSPMQDVNTAAAVSNVIAILNNLPHNLETRFFYSVHLAQLYALQNKPDKVELVWQNAETLAANLPDTSSYLAETKSALETLPVLQYPQHQMNYTLGETIRFEGFSISPKTPRHPEEIFDLTLFWYTLRPPQHDYTVFIHVYNQEGAIVLQDDFLTDPLSSTWFPSDIIRQTRRLALPTALQPGQYQIYMGMYLLETLERMPVTKGAAVDNAILLTTLQIKQ